MIGTARSASLKAMILLLAVWGCGGDDAANGEPDATAGGEAGAGAGASGSSTSASDPGGSGTGAGGDGGSGGSATCGPMPPIPELSTWEGNLATKGQKHCAAYDDPTLTFDQLLGSTYYDAERVFLQAAAYTGDAAWTTCAQKAEAIYRDGYVLPNNGGVPGYWNFTTGLTIDYLETGDQLSKDAVIALSMNAAYSADSTPLEWVDSPTLSREVAYAVRAHINAEKVGAAPRPRTTELVDRALGHIDQWFVSKTFRMPADATVPEGVAGQYYVQPFMVGLTAEALIMWEEKTGDERVLPALQAAMDWLWDNAWVPADAAFWYENFVPDPAMPFPSRPGAPDLNLLIAPAFAWLYLKTCDPKHLDRADQIFAGGKNAWLDNGKQFNQNYCWGFDYVAWRK